MTFSFAALLGCAGAAAPPAAADASAGDAGTGDAEATAADAPVEDRAPHPPVCRVRISQSHANVTAPEAAIAGSCPGERSDDGMGHRLIDLQPADMQAGVLRTFSIEQFEVDAPAGTRFALEAGFDPLGARGVSVRYLEISGGQTNTWRADRGVVTVVSARDVDFTLELAQVHMVPAPDPTATNRAMGDFQLDGTIVTVLP